MSKIVIGKVEVGASDIIKGAAIGAGVGFIAVGIKSIYDARKQKDEEKTPEEEELEFEEYLIKKARRKKLKKNLKISCGVYSILTGTVLAAAGIAAFTPLKQVVVTKVKTGSADYVRKVRDNQIDKIKEKLAIPKISESAVIYKIKDSDLLDKIKDNELILKIKENDILDKLKENDLLDRLKKNDFVDKLKDRDIFIRIKESDLVDKIKDADIIRRFKNNAA